MDFKEYSGKRSLTALAAGQEVAGIVVEHLDFRRIFESCIDQVETLIALKMTGGVLIQADPAARVKVVVA